MAASLGKVPMTSVRQLDLAVQPFDRIGGVQLGPMRGWKAHECQHIGSTSFIGLASFGIEGRN
jgi:hypothetical protein